MRLALSVLLLAAPGFCVEGSAGEAAALTAFLPERTCQQQFSFEFMGGGLLSPLVADIAFPTAFPLIQERSSFAVELSYRYYFDRAATKTPVEYRMEPSFWLEGGGGNWEIFFIVPFEYDLYLFGGGLSFPLGEQALIELECNDVIVKDFMDNALRADASLAFLPTGDFYFRLGWGYNWYDPTAGGVARHSNIVARAGYLWGSTEKGLDVSFSYRKRHENGSAPSVDVDYVNFGLDWYAGSRLSVGAGYEYADGAFDTGHAVDVTLYLRPTEQFRVGGGYRNHYLDIVSNDYHNYFVGMSYDF